MVRCHDAVRVAVVDRNFKPVGPWEKAPEKVKEQMRFVFEVEVNNLIIFWG